MSSSEVVKADAPEQREIERKRVELERLTAQLVEAELNLTTLQAELSTLSRRYQVIVARKYAELDAWRAHISAAEAAADPNDRGAKTKAEAAAKQASASARESGYAGWATDGAASPLEVEPAESPAFDSPERLKELFRRLAKLVHPDLAEDAADRERRTRLMAEVNAAYRAADIEWLHKLLLSAESAPEAVRGDGPAAELVRLIRRIAQTENRLSEAQLQLEKERGSEPGELLRRVKVAEAETRDLLWHLAAEVADQIVAERRRWTKLQTDTARSKS